MASLFPMSHCRNRYFSVEPTFPLDTACCSTAKTKQRLLQIPLYTRRKGYCRSQSDKVLRKASFVITGQEEISADTSGPRVGLCPIPLLSLGPWRELLNLSWTKHHYFLPHSKDTCPGAANLPNVREGEKGKRNCRAWEFTQWECSPSLGPKGAV